MDSMIDFNIANFITIGCISMLFAWFYTTCIKPLVSTTYKQIT